MKKIAFMIITIVLIGCNSQEFKTITLGDQVWMSENLNIDVDEGSYCYNNDPENCKKLGRLYSWEAAKKVVDQIDGWRLPTYDDYRQLIKYLHSNKSDRKINPEDNVRGDYDVLFEEALNRPSDIVLQDLGIIKNLLGEKSSYLQFAGFYQNYNERFEGSESDSISEKRILYLWSSTPFKQNDKAWVMGFVDETTNSYVMLENDSFSDIDNGLSVRLIKEE